MSLRATFSEMLSGSLGLGKAEANKKSQPIELVVGGGVTLSSFGCDLRLSYRAQMLSALRLGADSVQRLGILMLERFCV